MPLLKKNPFKKAPLPRGLQKNEEVFHCIITNEIFRDYEDYCQRVILCNSMVWTCSLTGKSGLTYTEALESEQNAQQIVKEFPTELRIPVLFLANKTRRTSFTEMCEDVFLYVKDRYFIGENVEASFAGNKWRESHILQVIPPSETQLQNAKKNGQSDTLLPPSAYRYEVEQLDLEDEDVSEVMVVDYEHIKRRKANYTRDKNKLFLKQFVEFNEQGVVVIKESVLESYGLNKIKFEQIFDGPIPNFDVSKKLAKTTVNGKKNRQETLVQFLTKNNGKLPSGKTINLLDQMKKRQEEFQQMRQQRADEKLAKKQKLKEDNLKIQVMLKEWYKPKEDLELEDHKILPAPAPLHSKVPDDYMGDVLSIIEFVHSFPKLLYSKDFFPDGLTIELMERALIQKEVAGPLTDVIQMFLNALFNVQHEESLQCSIDIDSTADIRGKDINDNISFTVATYFATLASNWSIIYQGLPINKLPLYSLTTSEILRLHLLGSGARINEPGAKWRYQHRGGYTSEDDPGLYLRVKYPHILKTLAIHNVTDLSIGDKLKITHCLMNQLLTYADVRDVIEDRLEKSKQAKLDLKTLQITERKREQEYQTAKLKMMREGKENNKDVAVDLEKLFKDSERKKVQNCKKIDSLMKQTTENLVLLGQDRAFQKYFKIESIPGVFVNFEEENPGCCLDKCVEQNLALVDADRTKTLLHLRKLHKDDDLDNCESEQEESEKVNGVTDTVVSLYEPETLMLCSADSTTCKVHCIDYNKQKWWFYHNPQQMEELISSLNIRGVRESDLKQVLVNQQSNLMSIIYSTPGNQLNPNIVMEETPGYVMRGTKKVGKPKYGDAHLGYPIEMSSASVLQLVMVDNILEMEEKIYAGSLGSIKVKNRQAWREQLNDRKFENVERTLAVKKTNSKIVDKVKKTSRPNTPDVSKDYKDPGAFLGNAIQSDSEQLPLLHIDEHKVAIETLAIALLQIAQGVESRHLKKPLGHAGMRSDAKKTEEYDVLERWESSLTASTSYSQLFLHYGTLDNSIMWSRSALLARCQICRRQTDSENMLLCDNCNKGHHLYCLKPKLSSVPKGDWFCKECQKQKDKEAKLKNPEPKQEVRKRRRIFKEEYSDEESSCESEESHKKKRKVSDDETFAISEDEMKLDDDETSLEESEELDVTENGTDKESTIIEVCFKCNVGGTLLCCDKCPDLYHLECAQPPLRRVPRGEWFCHKCQATKSRKNRGSSDDWFVHGKVAQRSGLVHNQRRCAARAQDKIYGFIKTLQRISDSEDSESDSDEVTTRRSNRREAESRDDLPLHNAPLQELLSDVLKHEHAWPFVRPVLKTEVPDYYKIITKPMDFGTVKYKLNMGKYSCDAELMADSALVFENCNTYNNSNDEVYKCGVILLEYFTSRCKDLGLRLTEEFDEMLTDHEKSTDTMDVHAE